MNAVLKMRTDCFGKLVHRWVSCVCRSLVFSVENVQARLHHQYWYAPRVIRSAVVFVALSLSLSAVTINLLSKGR